ncbi:MULTISPECIES: hemerythrin domain-containing protein [Bacteria]|uniref:hemerythrin domain-containing protein n=1 Tax=Bacteria TaxID=2 RepID=UPI003C7B7AFF
MSTDETVRVSAWAAELRAVHVRLRDALHATRSALAAGTEDPSEPTRDLLLYCHGFCLALDGHHRAEDRALFPAIEAAHPDLAPTLRALEQDHSMIAHLLGGLRAAVEGGEGAAVLRDHIDGVAAIMESHFRYEEKALLTVLETLALDASREASLGPL